MDILRHGYRGVVVLLVAVLVAGIVPGRPATAQEDVAAAVEALALRVHLQDLRMHSYTAWIGGPLGDPESTPRNTPLGERLDTWTLAGFAGDAEVAADQLTRPVLLNFWASWCPPCRLEFPHLVSVALEPDAHAFDVVFVNMADDAREAMAYLAQYPPEITTVRDENDRLSTRASVQSIPTSILLDADGTVLVVHAGMITPTITAFLDAVAAHPGEGAFVAADHGDVVPRAELAPVDGEAARPIMPGETVTGTISDEVFQQVYRFVGHAGDVVTIALQAESEDLDTYAVLMAADGTRIAENDDIDPGIITDSSITATLPADGDYLIVATRFLEAEGFATGTFSLQLSLTPAQVAPDASGGTDTGAPSARQGGGTVRYGETVRGVLEDTQFEQRWTFEGQRGEVIRVVMAAVEEVPGGLDGYLILEGPDGSVLHEVDDANDSVMPAIDAYELPANGRYTLVATRFGFANGFSEGEYTLTLEQVGALPALDASGSGIPRVRWLGPGTLPPGLRWLVRQRPRSLPDSDGRRWL